MGKPNLIKLAKGTPKKAETAKKPVEEKKLTPAEERDLKAKAKVEELLQDVSLTPQSKAEEESLIELDEPKGMEWLTEQVTALTAENDVLKAELVTAKEDYRRIFEELQRFKSGAGVADVSSDSILALFAELQTEYLRYPPEIMNQTKVNVKYLLDKLAYLFPVVKKIKKF